MYRSVPLCTLQFPVVSKKFSKFTALATAQAGLEMWDWGGGVW